MIRRAWFDRPSPLIRPSAFFPARRTDHVVCVACRKIEVGSRCICPSSSPMETTSCTRAISTRAIRCCWRGTRRVRYTSCARRPTARAHCRDSGHCRAIRCALRGHNGNLPDLRQLHRVACAPSLYIVCNRRLDRRLLRVSVSVRKRVRPRPDECPSCRSVHRRNKYHIDN